MKISYLNCSPMNRTNPLQKYPVCAIAYYVESVEAAAREHSRLFGSGPFFAITEQILFLSSQFLRTIGQRICEINAYEYAGILITNPTHILPIQDLLLPS